MYPVRRKLIDYLPVYGCISTALIYLAIGMIAILSFLRLKDGGADETSLLVFLNSYTLGKVLVCIILFGSFSYGVWRIYEAIKDPYHYGKRFRGIALRTGIALSTVADALIVYAAVMALFTADSVDANDQLTEYRGMIATLLRQHHGWMVIAGGAVVCITACVQFIYGVTEGYKERMDLSHYRMLTKKMIRVVAFSGYLARGIILGITGYFFLKAGMSGNAGYVVNTDKAFDFIGDHVGHVYFISVAVGTMCYGGFMVIMGAAYTTKKSSAVSTKK